MTHKLFLNFIYCATKVLSIPLRSTDCFPTRNVIDTQYQECAIKGSEGIFFLECRKILRK